MVLMVVRSISCYAETTRAFLLSWAVFLGVSHNISCSAKMGKISEYNTVYGIEEN